MSLDQSYIANLLAGFKTFWANGIQLPKRGVLRLLSGGSAVDNPNYVDPVTGQTVGSTDLTIATGGVVPPFLATTLRSTSASNTHDVRFVDGYYASGDGGGGYFEWVATDTTTADDGGTCFQVTSPPTPNGRWRRRQTDQWINGQWFGMQLGNTKPSLGGFDNTAAFSACITAANIQKKHIYLPPDPLRAYWFAVSAAATDPLPALTTASGIIGGTEGCESNLNFENTDGSCLKVRGPIVVRGLNVVNFRATALTNPSAVVHLINMSGAKDVQIHGAQGGANNSCVMLEQRHDWSQISNVQNSGGLVQITINYVDQNTSAAWTAEQKQHARPETGESWIVDNIVGSIGTNVNGLTWVIDVVSATSSSAVFTLRGSTASGTYTSGGSTARGLDPYLITHIGCWHNNFANLILTYLTGGTPLGVGLNFTVNSAAVNVTNPLGQNAFFPITKTGSVDFNRVNGFDIEGNGDGVLFNNASANQFTGGIFLGNGNQVHLTNSSGGNVFIGTHFDQWQTKAIVSDLTGHSNQFVGVQFFPNATDGVDVVRGTTDVVYTASDGYLPAAGVTGGLLFRGMIATPDVSARLTPIVYGGHQGWEIQSEAGIAPCWIGVRTDNNGFGAFYPFNRTNTPNAFNWLITWNPTGLQLRAASNDQIAFYTGDGSTVSTQLNSHTSGGFGGVAAGGGSPYLRQRSTVAVTGGTNALSAAQIATPILALTGTLASDQTLTLPNAAGEYLVDISGLTLAGHALIFACGSASFTATTLAASKTLLSVVTNPHGTNTLGVG